VEVFPFAGARQGRKAVLEALGGIAEHYTLERYKREIVIADGDSAAVMSDVSFKQRATGRTLRFRVANFLRFRDGKLIEFREFANTFDVVEQALGRWLQV
jgi:ketosteroid isomerase-like protein